MAKTCMIEKEKKRRRMTKQYAARKAKLKAILSKLILTGVLKKNLEKGISMDVRTYV